MLDVTDLHTSYGAVKALRGFTVKVAEGAIVALIGANGAGKSTLINSVAGVVKPAIGRVLFDGEDVTGLPSFAVARRGLIQVPEGRRVLGPLSVLENLELGRQALGRRGGSPSDLDDVFDLFPRLKERIGQAAGSLSGGEQQMLAIGRALMGRPKLLMLDEPSLGLAPVVVSLVFDALRQLNRAGLAMLLVEQNASRALDLASYAYVIERGVELRQGHAAALATDPAIKASYLGLRHEPAD